MATLQGLHAREVFDSRGRPTVEVEALASDGAWGRAIVPSGASTGRHEALELRDVDDDRFGGLGVLRAVENVKTRIANALKGLDLDDQAAIDAKLLAMDETRGKVQLGANAILGTSLAVARASAASRGEPLHVHLNRLWSQRIGPKESAEPSLPMPMVSMISGCRRIARQIAFQDFLMIPLGARSYSEALEMAVDLYRCLALVLRDSGEGHALVSDGGSYGPRLRTESHAVDRILEAALRCGLRVGQDMAVAIDVAASHIFDPETGRYDLHTLNESPIDSDEMVALLEHWSRQYPIISIEDGLAEDDWEGWADLTNRLGDRLQIIGDDLFATQADRLRQGIDRQAANAILIKLNQVGTLTETFDTMALARCQGYRAIISARSGETEDTTIADLAVATGAGQIKIGSVARSERLAKYNQLLRIEEALGDSARFAGREALGLA